MRGVLRVIVGVLVVAGAACGTGPEPTGSSEAPGATTVGTAEPTPTTDLPVSTVAEAATEDLVFATRYERELLIDVYVPEGDGPHPVVVAFHGLPSNKDENRPVGRAFAEAGFVTFVPTWLPADAMVASPTPEDLLKGQETAACALAFAQERADRYGGDAGNTVTYGFSGGGQPAAWLGLGHATDLPEDCVASVPPTPPIGAVLGDSEYFLHSTLFDGGFAADPAGMLERAGEFVDPDAWPETLAATFRIWSVEGNTMARRIDDPWDEDGWLAVRDPDGSIRADLESLGLLEDGVISNLDESALLALRLSRHGVDATHDVFPGGHEEYDKLDEIVAYLEEVVAVAQGS